VRPVTATDVDVISLEKIVYELAEACL